MCFCCFNPNCLISFLSSICLFVLLLFIWLFLFLLHVFVPLSLFLFAWFCFYHFSGVLFVFFFNIFFILLYFFIFLFLRCLSVVLLSPFSFSIFFFFFFYHFCQVVLFFCFIIQLALCFHFVFGFVFLSAFFSIVWFDSWVLLFGCSLAFWFIWFCFYFFVCVFPCFFFFDFTFYHLSGVLLIFFFFLIPFIDGMSDTWGLGPSTRSRAWGSEMGAPSPGCWTTREFPVPGKMNHWELSWRPPSESKTQLHPTASSSQCWTSHTKQQTRQEHKPIHQHTDYLKSY